MMQLTGSRRNCVFSCFTPVPKQDFVPFFSLIFYTLLLPGHPADGGVHPLPPLFMRTVISALKQAPRLRPFAADLLSRLISKQVGCAAR